MSEEKKYTQSDLDRAVAEERRERDLEWEAGNNKRFRRTIVSVLLTVTTAFLAYILLPKLIGG